MSDEGFSTEGLAHLDEVMAADVAAGLAPGAVWAVRRGGQTHVGAAGESTRDSIFRLSSMTKPITATAVMLLVEDGVVTVDAAVDPWLPELADPQVLRNPDGPLEDTVSADRAITVEDLLTFTFGTGLDFTRFGQQPVLAAGAGMNLGDGPPAPDHIPDPDTWIGRFGTLPLERQPGERWLYHVGSEVLSVLVARASGQPFEAFLEDRVFAPLGMVDTAFWVPPDKQGRLGPTWAEGDDVYDPPDGQWSRPPAFPSGGGGLVSTVDDYLAFGSMLMADGGDLLTTDSVRAMTTDHLTEAQRKIAGPHPSGTVGWGYGVGVQVEPSPDGPWSVGTYTWGGGLGTNWANDPAQDLVGVLLTSRMQTSPYAMPIYDHFWAAAYEAISS